MTAPISAPENSANPLRPPRRRPEVIYGGVAIGALGLPQTTHRLILSFRRQVHAALLAANGTVSIAQAKKLRTATIALAESKRAQMKLVKGGLTQEQEAAWSDRLVRNEERCDRALEALGLTPDEKPDDLWRGYRLLEAAALAAPSPSEAPDQPEDRPDAPDTAEATPEAGEGGQE